MLHTAITNSLILINILVILIFILIGGLIPLIERKFLSLIQRRVGPKYVGYNGRLQFLADALKLLLKEIIFLINTNRFLFFILPIFLLNINIILVINIIWFNNIKLIDNEYLTLTILLIEIVTNAILIHIGFIVKNKYTLLSSVRILNGVVIFEIFIATIYIYIYLQIKSFNINQINNNLTYLNIQNQITFLPIIIYFILIMIKKVPFDLIEAETELIMGYAVEHGGFLAGALILIEYLHLFFWSYILTIFIF